MSMVMLGGANKSRTLRSWPETAIVILCLSVLLPCAHATVPRGSRAPVSQLRAPTIEDFLNLRQIEEVSPSPNGRMLAVVVTRRRYGHIEGELPGDRHRTDIYVLRVKTGKVLGVIDSRSRDGSSFWGPLWSPDGTRIALLTDEGRAHSLVRPAVWSVRTGRYAVLGQRSVDFRVNWGDRGAGQWSKWGMWIDDGTLMTVLLPAGTLADSIRLQAPETPALDWDPLWRRTAAGKRAVTVWTSPSNVVCGGKDELVTMSVVTGGQHVIYRGPIRGASVAPDRKLVAILAARFSRPSVPDRKDVWFEALGSWEDVASTTISLAVVDVRTGMKIGDVPDLEGLRPTVRMFPVWSPHDAALAVPAHPAEGHDVVFYVQIPSLHLSRYVARNALDALVVAQLLTMAGAGAEKGVVAPGRARFALTPGDYRSEAPVRRVPGLVIRLEGERIGVLLHGTLTVLSKAGSASAVLKGVGDTLVYPQADQAVEVASSAIVAEDARGSVDLVDLRSEAPKVTRIGHAPADAEVGWLARRKALLLVESGRTGTELSITRGREVARLLTLNRYLSRVAPPTQKLISYGTGGEGKVLGRLWLPPGFRRGIRRPLIVYGYPEFYVRDVQRNPFRDLWMYPAVLLANAGYVVLQPTIPARLDDTSPEFDPIVYYNRAVVTAVEAAVTQGYAEPAQVGYYGHSYGGYVGLALEARTHLFKAIVVVSPFANLIEMHDTAEPPLTDLNECTPTVLLSASVLYEEAEGTVLDMGYPPWKDFGRYSRNSPYFNLRYATTPLLMEKGQFDGDLPAIRGVFSELDRMGVPAELAVYWGEGHLLRTRGNVMDGWRRALNWLNRWVRDGNLPRSRNLRAPARSGRMSTRAGRSVQ